MATKDKLVNLEDLKAVHDIDAAAVSDLKSALGFAILDKSKRTEINGTVDSEGKWLIDGSRHVSFQYPVNGLKSIVVTANSARNTLVSFLASSAVQLESGQTPDFAGEETGRHTIVAGATETLSVPENCAYLLFVHKLSNGGSYMPTTCEMVYSDGAYNELNGKIEQNRTDIDGLEGTVQTIGLKSDKTAEALTGISTLQPGQYDYTYTLENGAIDGNGANVNSTLHTTNSCRTADFINTKGADKIHVEFARSSDAVLPSQATNYYLYINFYDAEKTFISRDGGESINQVDVNSVPENTEYFRVSFTYTKQSELESHTVIGYKETEIVSTVSKLNMRVPIKGIVLGDSISFGLWSYWDGNQRKNADDLYPGHIEKTAAPIRISDWLAEYYGVKMENIAKRGTGWVADTRNLGNAWVKAQATDFSNYDFVALCFGVNDYIQKKPLGSLADNTIGTVIGNMIHVLEKIYTDNPLIKVVVFSPLNTWGQYRDTEGVSQVYYGDASTHFALGYDFEGTSYTLQALIDAMESVCDRYDVRHVVMSQGCTINVFNIKDILIDGLHPSQESMKSIASDMYHAMLFR